MANDRLNLVNGIFSKNPTKNLRLRFHCLVSCHSGKAIGIVHLVMNSDDF